MAYELDHSVWVYYFVWYGFPQSPDDDFGLAHWMNPREYTDKEGKVCKKDMRDPRNWIAPGKRDAAASHYPLLGCYKSDDENVILWHLEKIRQAGIDGLMVSWFGPNGPDGSIEPTEKVLRMLPPLAKEYDLHIGINFDGVPEPDVAVKRLKHIWEMWGENERFLDSEGRIMVYCWMWGMLGCAGIDRIKAQLEAAGTRFFLVGDAPFFKELIPEGEDPEALGERFDALGHFTCLPDEDMIAQHELARKLGKLSVGTVSPGIDISSCRVEGHRPVVLCPREDGKFYKNKWDLVAGQCDTDVVFIDSWNEWHEGAEIEPSREYGDLYLGATRYYAKLYRERRWNEFSNEELEQHLDLQIE